MADLITLDTDALQLTLGRARRAEVATSWPGAIRPHASALASGVAVYLDAQCDVLHEETAYTVLLRSKTDARVQLHQRDLTLLRGLTQSEGGRLWHGTLNFGSQVGPACLEAWHGGKPHAALYVEVVPTKLAYRADFEALRDAVEEMAEGLALGWLRATHPAGSPVETSEDTVPGAAFLAHLGVLLGELEEALQHIAAAPRGGARDAEAWVRAERVRRATPHAIRALRQSGAGSAPTSLLRLIRPEETLATQEHAWIAREMERVAERIVLLRERAAERPESARRGVQVAKLAHLGARIERAKTLLPGSPPTRGAAPPTPTLRLRTAPGYREAFGALVGLRRGLDLRGMGRAYSLRDLHALYEMWCSLAVARAVDVASLTEPGALGRQLLRTEHDGLRVRLSRGRKSAIRFQLGSGHLAILTVQPRFHAPLLPQQPDLTLDLLEDDGHGHRLIRRLVLDAKYRLDASASAIRRYGLPAPPSEALLTLHRYRDAVPHATHAAALYPWSADDAFATSPLRRALDTDGVGAIPLLPGSAGALRAFIAGWLAQATL